MIGYEERFEVLARLCGKEALATLREATAIVVGLGGVGSWAAEAMARSAIGHLQLVDMDTVAVSNTNRQSEAMEGAYGRSKAEVLSERLRAINPEADIEVLVERVTEENVSRIITPNAFVLECVDDVDAKAAILLEARKKGDFVIVSGGAGGRRDPTRIRVADLAHVTDDPLLSKLRYNLRKNHGFPAGSMKKSKPFGLLAAFSTEPMQHGPMGDFGTLMPVTVAMGMAVAASALNAILREVKEEEK